MDRENSGVAIYTRLIRSGLFLTPPDITYTFQKDVCASQVQRQGSVFVVAILGYWFALNAALILGLGCQKNWARVTQMILTLAGLLFLTWFVAFSATSTTGNLHLVSATAAVLLFLPSVNAWFSRR